MLHEEGRVRSVRDTAGKFTELTFDYFLRDHLGSVRMVLTDEQKTDMYLPATMELEESSTEKKLYTNVNSTRADTPGGYPTDDYTDPNEKVAVVNGSGNKTGPSMVLIYLPAGF